MCRVFGGGGVAGMDLGQRLSSDDGVAALCEAADADRVVDLVFLGAASGSELEESIAAFGRNAHFIALDGPRYVGVCSLRRDSDDTLRIGLTGVLPAYRRRGLGRLREGLGAVGAEDERVGVAVVEEGDGVVVVQLDQDSGDEFLAGQPAVQGPFEADAHRCQIGFVMGGLPAWTVWRVNYLMQLLGVRNRGTLLVEWVLSFFAGRLVANTP